MPELQEAYFKLVNLVLNSNQKNTIKDSAGFHCSATLYECKRGWKIKCFLGAIGYTVGLFIAPFNPAIGISIISSAGGLILDGAIGAIDEKDDRSKNSVNQCPNSLINVY